MKRIAMVVVDRANWGRLEPLFLALANRREPILPGLHYEPGFEPVFSVQVVGTDAFWDADPVALLKLDIPRSREKRAFCVEHTVRGDTMGATVRTIGHGVSEYAGAFERILPDIVLIIGDRREALAAAIAAAHSGAKLVHLQGGETSGTLDQKYRWAITALADYHVPATRNASHALTAYLCDRGDDCSIIAQGCPSSDLAREVLADKPARTPEVLVCYHPNTCHPETAAAEAEALFSALPSDRPVTVLSTNPDAGRGPIVEACKRHGYAMQSLEPREFARRLATCALAVGNSSGFVRDSGFYGTPVVLVGDRQNGRERGENVMQVACIKGEIEAGIEWQLEHGPYPPSDLYGDGRVCERIVEALRKL